MIKEITMPAGGQTTDTSMVSEWLVKEGDKVNRGDALLEIETDKATLTVESFAKGIVLAIVAEQGDELPAGAVLAYVGDENDKAELNTKLENKTENIEKEEVLNVDEEEYQPIDLTAPVRYVNQIKQENSTLESKCEEIKAMPNAKKLAKENGVSLSSVAQFVGKNTLKKQDVVTYLKSEKNDERIVKNDVVIPLTKKRKVIAQRMLESSQNIPAFTASVEVNMEQCILFRKITNESKERRISYNDILLKCIEAATRKYPYVNASYTEEGIVIHEDVNVGLAVGVDTGLVVPVVKNVEIKNVLQIAEENRQNIEKARNGSLSIEEMTGGTITLSNLGMYPITKFTAIINPPEVCILAVGAMEDKPILKNGLWTTVPMMTITGSFDHRVVDGAYGAQFLAELKKIIENPVLALL